MPGTLAEALAQLQGCLPDVAKTADAQYGKYADLTVISRALLPVMASLGLSFFAGPTLEGDRFVLGYRLMHKSGEELAGAYPLPTSGTPQQVGSAITYARRYTLCAVTGLAPGGDDDDGNAAEQEHKDRAPARQPRNVPDAQLAAGGQMTRGQKAEHERLAADTVRDPKRAERSRGQDPDDPWAQDAPVDHQRAAAMRASLDGRDLTDPEDKPGSSTVEQQQQIAIRLAGKGITVREDKLWFCSRTAGRDIGSSKELAFNEALAILKAADELEAVNA